MYVNTLVMCPFLCAVLCDVNKCLSLSLSLSSDRLKDLVQISSERDIADTMELEALVDVIEEPKENCHILPLLYTFSFSFSYFANQKRI